MMNGIKQYFINWGLTIAAIFWLNLLNLCVTFRGLYSALVHDEKFWPWAMGIMIQLGIKAMESINKFTNKKGEENVDRTA